jgi:predicted DNA-binding transcriptional regulator YafY
VKSPNELPNELTIAADELFFLAEAIRHARTLPLIECRQFLNGMITSLTGAHPARRRLSLTIESLDSSDAQMEMMQVGQLKPDLAPNERKAARQ